MFMWIELKFEVNLSVLQCNPEFGSWILIYFQTRFGGKIYSGMQINEPQHIISELVPLSDRFI